MTKEVRYDLKNRPTPPTKPSIGEPSALELKKIFGHLKYAFLGDH